MRLVLISDTHGLHDQVKLPDGDCLIHAGDFMNHGTKSEELISFAEWFKAQPHKYKIVVAGNHDFFLEQDPFSRNVFTTVSGPKIHYLEDSGVCLEGIKFWGSPVTPRFFDWAFNRDRGFAINQHWRMIPDGTNVLVTHGPPAGILDICADGTPVGCQDLFRKINQLPDLKLNAFGHIHHSYGHRDFGDLMFVNASQCNESYKIRNQPIVHDIEL